MLVIRANARQSSKAIKHALNESVNGRSGRNVFASDSAFHWNRIMAVRIHRELLEGRRLNDGTWFVIYNWEER
jgi:hypothetical protein